MMTDPIADMLTRIRNAVRVERPVVEMPLSKVKRGLAEVLKREGYIWDWEELDEQPARGEGPGPRLHHERDDHRLLSTRQVLLPGPRHRDLRSGSQRRTRLPHLRLQEARELVLCSA